MLYIESVFNKALEIVATESNTTVEAVKTCYEYDLYNTMERVREVYTSLYNGVEFEAVEEAEEVEVVEVEKVTIKQAIEAKELAIKEIDKKVFSVKGTWVKHRNLRKKLNSQHNEFINGAIEEINKKVRLMVGIKEQEKRGLYHAKTVLELQVI